MKKILLIEDNAELRENTAEILELANYNVLTAEDGKQGVQSVIENKPDLIICDIMMPVLDGYGVLYSIHKNPEVRNTPFIFLTAKSERGEIRQGMDMGADDYITKPFNGTELLAAIESRLKKIEELKEEFGGSESLHANGSAEGKEMLNMLISGRNVNKYKRKQVIYNEGNRPSRLMYLQKGKVKAYKTNEEGKELVVALYTEGDFIGYSALLDGTTYKDTAEAMEDCEVAIIPQHDFEELLYSNSYVTRQFIKLLAKDVAEKESQLLGIAYNSLRKKVANALLTLKNKYKGNDEKFSIDISRENLASIAGTATESLIRTLTDFKNEKLIDVFNNRHITILNEHQLENMVN